MRVLFLESHPMWIYGLPNGFLDAGHQVKISGPLTRRKIPRLIAAFRPHLIVTLGWTNEHHPLKRKWIRKYVGRSGIPHVFWATEDPTHHDTFSSPYVKSVKPDFVFTICREMVKKYEKMGIPAAHSDFGHHRKVHINGKKHARFLSNITVVANGYSQILKKYPRHYRIKSLHNLIRPLVARKIRINFWGRQWKEIKPVLGVRIPNNWIHGYLPYQDAYKAYNSAKIIIGPQNQLKQVTQRTYEILGSGGFLLTSDTPEIRRLFKPGKHLVVSKSPAETVRLVRYYLKHPGKRAQISKAGKLAVAKHSYKYRAIRMIRELKKRNILK